MWLVATDFATAEMLHIAFVLPHPPSELGIEVTRLSLGMGPVVSLGRFSLVVVRDGGQW